VLAPEAAEHGDALGLGEPEQQLVGERAARGDTLITADGDHVAARVGQTFESSAEIHELRGAWPRSSG
jgi:hypothetical protein